MTYQVSGLPLAPFLGLFERSNTELARQQAKRLVVDSHPGYPCRVSLQDAAVGEHIIALPYQHQPADSPYRASGPIFVRANAVESYPAVESLPRMLLQRLQSVRAYSNEHCIVFAEVAGQHALHDTIVKLLSEPAVSYLHLHNANPGCFNCRIDRTY